MSFPPPEDLLDPGIEPTSLMSPALAGGFFTISTKLSILSHVQRAIESAVIKTKLYWVKPYAIVSVVQNWLNFGNSYGSAKQKNVF